MSPLTHACPGRCGCRVRWDRLACYPCWRHLPKRHRDGYRAAIDLGDRQARDEVASEISGWLAGHPAPAHRRKTVVTM